MLLFCAPLFQELFQTLFNILYEENIDCRLVKSVLFDEKLLNWNRLNAQICFNYLQQEFYLVKPTMRTLAQGKSEKAVLKLLRVLINTSQSNFGDLALDDECIRDIADVIEADAPQGIIGQAAMSDGTQLNIRPRGAFMTDEGYDEYQEDLRIGTQGAAAADLGMEETKQGH